MNQKNLLSSDFKDQKRKTGLSTFLVLFPSTQNMLFQMERKKKHRTTKQRKKHTPKPLKSTKVKLKTPKTKNHNNNNKPTKQKGYVLLAIQGRLKWKDVSICVTFSLLCDTCTWCCRELSNVKKGLR